MTADSPILSLESRISRYLNSEHVCPIGAGIIKKAMDRRAYRPRCTQCKVLMYVESIPTILDHTTGIEYRYRCGYCGEQTVEVGA